MRLPLEVFGSVAVVHTPEEVGEEFLDTFPNFVTQLEQNRLVVDLDATETIDSKGLNALLEAQETLHELGGELKISSENAVNRKILEITRLDLAIEVFESVLDAVKSYT